MKSRSSAGTSVPKSGHLSEADKLARFLRARHPFKTAIAVEAETGVSEAAVSKLLTRGSLPSFFNLWRLLDAYGPALAVAALDNPPEWLCEAARRAETQDKGA